METAQLQEFNRAVFAITNLVAMQRRQIEILRDANAILKISISIIIIVLACVCLICLVNSLPRDFWSLFFWGRRNG